LGAGYNNFYASDPRIAQRIRRNWQQAEVNKRLAAAVASMLPGAKGPTKAP
jgi:hypothetical protein